jgi:hypothetical protein
MFGSKGLTGASITLAQIALPSAFSMFLHVASLYAETGTVIDGGTGKPLSGVYVVTTWSADVFKGIESSHSCFKVEASQTDSEGKFHIASSPANLNPLLYNWERDPLWFYKKGYAYLETVRGTGDAYIMHLDSRNGSERLKYISRTMGKTSCGSAEERELRGKLLPVYRAVWDEARSIPANQQDERTLDSILFDVEALEIGRNLAIDNSLQREKARRAKR